MARPLDELRALAKKHSAAILYAGDIFDKWDQPPEMINWAIDHLPPGISVPGQHDMPYHDPALMHKSAYQTLVKAEVLRECADDVLWVAFPTSPTDDGSCVDGFPWKRPGASVGIRAGANLQIALVHRYVWMDDGGHPGAKPEDHAKQVLDEFTGYDLVICGDNHKTGNYVGGMRQIINCGGFMRRKTDEISHRPRVLLIHADGIVSYYYLDITKDIITSIAEPQVVPERTPDMLIEDFVQTLSTITTERCSFRDAIHAYLREHITTVSPRVAEIILQAIRE